MHLRFTQDAHGRYTLYTIHGYIVMLEYIELKFDKSYHKIKNIYSTLILAITNIAV